MGDPALYGHCLCCGKTAYAQSYCRDHQMDELRAEVANLKSLLDIKNTRIAEIESRCRYKEATIKELLDGLEALGRSLNELRG